MLHFIYCNAECLGSTRTLIFGLESTRYIKRCSVDNTLPKIYREKSYPRVSHRRRSANTFIRSQDLIGNNNSETTCALIRGAGSIALHPLIRKIINKKAVQGGALA